MASKKARPEVYQKIADTISPDDRPDDLPPNTYRSWKKRILDQDISMDKIREILLRLGYKRISREIWEKKGNSRKKIFL